MQHPIELTLAPTTNNEPRWPGNGGAPSTGESAVGVGSWQRGGEVGGQELLLGGSSRQDLAASLQETGLAKTTMLKGRLTQRTSIPHTCKGHSQIRVQACPGRIFAGATGPLFALKVNLGTGPLEKAACRLHVSLHRLHAMCEELCMHPDQPSCVHALCTLHTSRLGLSHVKRGPRSYSRLSRLVGNL